MHQELLAWVLSVFLFKYFVQLEFCMTHYSLNANWIYPVDHTCILKFISYDDLSMTEKPSSEKLQSHSLIYHMYIIYFAVMVATQRMKDERSKEKQVTCSIVMC